MGLVGAAVATCASQAVGGFFPLTYFARKNSSTLKLTKTRFDGKALLKTCSNGASEFMSNISMSIVGMLYNVQLLHYAGENGVAAYGVLMYVSMIFSAVFIGYSIGSAPIISFHFGAKNRHELRNLLAKSVVIIGVSSTLMTALAMALASPLSHLFVGYDEALLSLTIKGFFIYSLSFLFMGFAIFGSGFFTALNDGITSAMISFLRTVVFQVAAILLLPLILGTDGIWWSIVAAELMAFVISFTFIFAKRKKYGYTSNPNKNQFNSETKGDNH
jgi:Na+-driven multidrug efflux pump